MIPTAGRAGVKPPAGALTVLAGLAAGALALGGLAACSDADRPGDPSLSGARPQATSTPDAASSALPSSRPSSGPSKARLVFPVRAKDVWYGKAHHDYPATDIFAACGSPAVAVTDGTISEVTREDTWDSRRNDGATRGGLSVSIVGDDGVRYYGSHLRSVVTGVEPGRRVRAGETLGKVGRTGSARPTPCHLHFGISPACGTEDWWNRRGVLSPYRFLRSWEDGGQRSPVKAVAAWRAEHDCPARPPKGA